MERLYTLVHKLRRLWWRVAKPITVGARVLLIRDQTVLLVRHSADDTWYLVGGGVKGGESPEQAARREAAEEVGALLGDLKLLGVYSNFFEGKSDHVVVFACGAFSLDGRTDREIKAFGFFPVHGLPNRVSPGTRRG